MMFDPKDPSLRHVYPTVVDLPDIHQTATGERVEAPMKECALCREGSCVQRLDALEPRVVVHGKPAA